MQTTDEVSIITLLREISSSLATIKDQQTALRDYSVRTNCCSHGCQPSLAIEKPIGHNAFNHDSMIRTTRQESYSPSIHIDSSTSDKDVTDTEKRADYTVVPYTVSPPMEQHILGMFGSRYKDVLDSSYVLKRLTNLPPDDQRLPLLATRGTFLRQLTSDRNPLKLSGATEDSMYVKEVLRELDLFQDFRPRIGSGHFWIRDYDSHGCYTQWDCVNSPKVILNGVQEKSTEFNIPDLVWPLDWSIHQISPVAPWRRIMYFDQ